MTMLTPRPRRNPLLMPFFFAALGVGLAGWYGQAWHELPRYSDSDIDASVEANLAVDLARLGANLQPDKSGLERLRAQIHAEVLGDINKDKREAQQGFAAGLICLVLSAGHLLFVRLTRPQ